MVSGPVVDASLAFGPVENMGELHVVFMHADGSPAGGAVEIGGQRAIAQGGLAIVGNIPTQGKDGPQNPYTTFDANGNVIGQGYMPIPYSAFGVAATLVIQGAP